MSTPDLPELYKYADLLPGERSWIKLAPPGRFPLSVPKKNPKQAAVLILLFMDNAELCTLLIKRTSNPQDPHSGQLSFPGGKWEEADASYWNTAIRETQEETGIEAEKIEHIYSLSTLYVPVSNFEIYPQIGWIEDTFNLELSASEAEQAFIVPLTKFSDGKLIKYMPYPNEGNNKEQWEIPYYDLSIGIPLWGATAMIITELVDWFAEINKNQSQAELAI